MLTHIDLIEKLLRYSLGCLDGVLMVDTILLSGLNGDESGMAEVGDEGRGLLVGRRVGMGTVSLYDTWMVHIDNRTRKESKTSWNKQYSISITFVTL